MSSLRTIMAWAVAVAAVVCVQFWAVILGGKVGVPVSMDIEPYFYYTHFAEHEVSSIVSTYGWGMNLLSVLAAVLAWHFVQKKRFTPEGRVQFLGFLLGGVVLIVGGVPLWKAFANSEGLTDLGQFLELGLFGAAFYAGYKLIGHLRERSPP